MDILLKLCPVYTVLYLCSTRISSISISGNIMVNPFPFHCNWRGQLQLAPDREHCQNPAFYPRDKRARWRDKKVDSRLRYGALEKKLFMLEAAWCLQ
jgi:hypothetical protein